MKITISAMLLWDIVVHVQECGKCCPNMALHSCGEGWVGRPKSQLQTSLVANNNFGAPPAHIHLSAKLPHFSPDLTKQPRNLLRAVSFRLSGDLLNDKVKAPLLLPNCGIGAFSKLDRGINIRPSRFQTHNFDSQQ